MRRDNRFPNIFAFIVSASFGLLLFSGLFMGCEKEVEVIVHDTVEVEVMVEVVTVDAVVSIGDPVEGGGSLELTATTTAGSEAGALTYAWFATAGDFKDFEADTVTWTAPDDSGAVTITVHATDGTYIGIGSAVVGVGMYAPTATEWYIGAETCGTCHTGDGTGYKDKYTAWSGTMHANAFDESQASYCAPCHTVGVRGLDEAIDGDAGYDDAPIATYVNIQCENCHGRGSTHQSSFSAADISISYDAATCGSCHSGARHPFYDEWSVSKHASPTTYPMGRSSCQGCHEGVAAAERLSGDLSTFYASGTIDRTGGISGRDEPNIGFVCGTCHDSHDASNMHQLRTTADVQLVTANGASPIITSGGPGKLCMQCHHARRSADSQIGPGYGHFGPHSSPQGDMLTGNSGYEGVAPAGFAWAQPNHGGLEEACITCHMHKIDYNTTMPDSSAKGHTFEPIVEACAPCHGEIDAFEDILAFDDYDGDGAIEGAEDEVHGLLHILTDSLTARVFSLGIDTTAAAEFDLIHTIGDSLHYIYTDTVLTDSVVIPALFREAGYNLAFVEADGSHGMHNFDYTVQLLQQAFLHLTGSLPAGAAPLIGNGGVATR